MRYMKDISIIFILFIIGLIIFNSQILAYNTTLVYIDKENIDSKYHRQTCNHILPNRYRSIIVEEAFEIGYRGCPDCSPPLSDKEYEERYKAVQELTQSINPTIENNSCKPSTSSNSANSSNSEIDYKSAFLKQEILPFAIVIIILSIIWTLCNRLFKILLYRYQECNEFVTIAFLYRKNLLFDIFCASLIFVFDFKILIYIAIVYYLVFIITEAIMIIIGIYSMIKEKDYSSEKNSASKLMLCKLLSEFASIIMLEYLFNCL